MSASQPTKGTEIAALEAVRKLNQYRETQGLPALRIGIGIHTGPVAAGMLGLHDRFLGGDRRSRRDAAAVILSPARDTIEGRSPSRHRLQQQSVRARQRAEI